VGEYNWKLTLILLTWRIGSAPNNASRWQMGFNLAFKGLMCLRVVSQLAPLLWPQKGVKGLNFATSSLCTSSFSILLYTPLKSLGHSVHMEVRSDDLFL